MNKHDAVININAMLDKAEPPVTTDYCIYKVPFVIRRHNDDAYTPKFFSIGPFHHRHPHLQNMERHKLLFFNAFHQRDGITTQPLVHYIDSIIPEFRRCYSETLDFTHQGLVKLILINSVFIIELFLRHYYGHNDVFLLEPWLDFNLSFDLLLLENQLPFFVVEQIFNISFSAETYFPSFLDLTFHYFRDYNKSNLVSDNSVISINHFTDLIRFFHLQHQLWQHQFSRYPQRRPRPIGTPRRLKRYYYSVMELIEAGVRFKPSTNDSLFDLKFLGRVLEIPRLEIQDWTEMLFRNMVALEHCYFPFQSYITAYICVLDFLINTEKDVDILVRKGILVNWLGDNDSVAKLVNSLCKNVILSNYRYDNSHYDYFDLHKSLDDFYNDGWHKLKATLRRDYCSTPWQTAASVAAILLLILSILQSVCSVVQIVKQ